MRKKERKKASDAGRVSRGSNKNKKCRVEEAGAEGEGSSGGGATSTV